MIGILSSGLGGLLFARELAQHAADAGFLYWGDTAHGPYGSRSVEQVGAWVREGLKFLEKKGAEAIVVASGDASVASRFADPRKLTTQMYPEVNVPVIDYWDAQIKAALAATKKKRMGFFGPRLVTERTGMLGLELQGVAVLKKAVAALTPFILEGEERRGETRRLVRAHLQWFKTQNIDVLMLGSMHYARVFDDIKAKMGKRVTVIHPAQALLDLCIAMGLASSSKEGARQCYLTDITPRDLDIAHAWFGQPVHAERVV